ncbi:MAG: hypothetical protein MJ107_00120 [Lachnospiraceae bacterium]|nr:hypothetical protein [Lachnospiraceae bacterium]
MNMIISGVSEKDGKKIAYVSFEEGERIAEAIIPDCKILSNKGFSADEADMLEAYLRENLASIKREAAAVNPIRAMMKD